MNQRPHELQSYALPTELKSGSMEYSLGDSIYSDVSSLYSFYNNKHAIGILEKNIRTVLQHSGISE